MAVIALFPTAFFQSSTYTYDYWIIAWIMAGFSFFINEMIDFDDKSESKNLIFMIGSFVLAMGPKPIYVPLMLPLYFIGKRKFIKIKLYKKYLFYLTGFIVLIFGSFFLPFLSSGGSGYSDYRGGENISSADQLMFIINNPLAYSKILLSSLKGLFSLDNISLYTTNIGYLGGASYSTLSWLLLTFVAVTNKSKKDLTITNVKIKLTVTAAIFIAASLIATALYISFNPVGTIIIDGVQPRYLLPFLFPFAMVIGSSKIENNINTSVYSNIVFGISGFVLSHAIWEVCVSKL
jgi:uncharacterized membrane protein